MNKLLNYLLGITLIIAIFLIVYIIVNVISKSRFTHRKLKNNQKTSVIIASYDRPHNIKKLVPIIKKYKNIKDIIISHGNPDTYFELDGCKSVKNYEINSKIGGGQRFFSIKYVNTPYVLFLDDDTIPSESLVNELLYQVQQNPNTIYGPLARTCNENGYKSFFERLYLSSYNYILTPCLMTSTNVIKKYLKNFDRLYRKHLEETKGNGEDLTLNHFVIHYLNEKPKQIGNFMNITSLDEKTGSYSGKPKHMIERNNFCKTRENKLYIHTFHIVVVCTPNYDDIGGYGVNSLYKYAKSHGYGFTCVRKPIEGLHVNFTKNIAAIEAIKNNKEDFIVNIDADIGIKQPEKTLDDILNSFVTNNAVMYAPPDKMFLIKNSSGTINAGFIVWKSCDRSIEINQLWLDKAKNECNKLANIHPRQQNVFRDCVEPTLNNGELVYINASDVGVHLSKIIFQPINKKVGGKKYWEKMGSPQFPIKIDT
jgi:hypothetical protein